MLKALFQMLIGCLVDKYTKSVSNITTLYKNIACDKLENDLFLGGRHECPTPHGGLQIAEHSRSTNESVPV